MQDRGARYVLLTNYDSYVVFRRTGHTSFIVSDDIARDGSKRIRCDMLRIRQTSLEVLERPLGLILALSLLNEHEMRYNGDLGARGRGGGGYEGGGGGEGGDNNDDNGRDGNGEGDRGPGQPGAGDPDHENSGRGGSGSHSRSGNAGGTRSGFSMELRSRRGQGLTLNSSLTDRLNHADKVSLLCVPKKPQGDNANGQTSYVKYVKSPLKISPFLANAPSEDDSDSSFELVTPPPLARLDELGDNIVELIVDPVGQFSGRRGDLESFDRLHCSSVYGPYQPLLDNHRPVLPTLYRLTPGIHAPSKATSSFLRGSTYITLLGTVSGAGDAVNWQVSFAEIRGIGRFGSYSDVEPSRRVIAKVCAIDTLPTKQQVRVRRNIYHETALYAGPLRPLVGQICPEYYGCWGSLQQKYTGAPDADPEYLDVWIMLLADAGKALRPDTTTDADA